MCGTGHEGEQAERTPGFCLSSCRVASSSAETGWCAAGGRSGKVGGLSLDVLILRRSPATQVAILAGIWVSESRVGYLVSHQHAGAV